MGYCYKNYPALPFRVDAFSCRRDCFTPKKDVFDSVQCRRCVHFRLRRKDKDAPKGHIPKSVAQRCATSSTLYSCTIRHSYENDPIFPLSGDGWKMRNWDRGFESKYIIREFVNVGQGVQIDTLLDYKDWYTITCRYIDENHSKMELTQRIYIGNKVIELNISQKNWESKCCDDCLASHDYCYSHNEPCDRLKKEREEQQVSTFEKELLVEKVEAIE